MIPSEKKTSKQLISIYSTTIYLSFLKNIGSIILNIVIIVFSVYLANYIDKRREYERKQADVKEFLLGLKTDLSNDIREMKEDKKAYQTMKKCFRRLLAKNQPPPDSISLYTGVI